MTLRALVVDDEPVARRRLRALLTSEPRVEIVGECEDGYAALDAIKRLGPDLMFLDVQMPGLDGFDVIELLEPAECPAVIFVTAYDKYAMRAFDVCAADYLLKPFEPRRLGTAVSRAAALAGRADNPARLHALVENVRAGRPLQRFLVRTPGRAHAVRTEDVESIEAADHYVELRTADGAHLLRETLSSIERRLDPAAFVRIHRSTIVNVACVGELRSRLHGEAIVVLASGRRVRCSRTYAASLKQALVRA
jgi:two-component system LytT family response regulator